MSEAQTVYVIIQEAVYRHCIGGIFFDLDKAVTVANKLAGADRDNHHNWQVTEFPFDEKIQVDWDGDESENGKVVYAVKSIIQGPNYSFSETYIKPDGKFVVVKELNSGPQNSTGRDLPSN